jgi:hypothetical protein
MKNPFIKKSLHGASSEDLEARVCAALDNRLRSLGHFSAQEIVDVTQKKRTVFPPGFALPSEITDEFRSLAKFAQLELRPAAAITSHRRFIGPLIVALKRLTWPLIALHLKDTVNAVREFEARSLFVMGSLVAAQDRTRSGGKQL